MASIDSNELSLFEQYPHAERFQLTKDGVPAEKVLLPVHIHNYDWALLAGAGDAKDLERVLALQDLDLAEFQPASGLNVGIFAINYKESDVGAFREYYLVVAAKDRAIECRMPSPERAQGFFVWDIELDSDLAIRFGRQVWGHPKTYANGRVGWNLGNFEFEFLSPSGASMLSGRCADCERLSFEFVRFPPFYFITPYETRRSWAKALNEGESAGRAYDPERDSFDFDPESRVGAKLRRIGFKPSYWTVGHNVRAVGLK